MEPESESAILFRLRPLEPDTDQIVTDQIVTDQLVTDQLITDQLITQSPELAPVSNRPSS